MCECLCKNFCIWVESLYSNIRSMQGRKYIWPWDARQTPSSAPISCLHDGRVWTRLISILQLLLRATSTLLPVPQVTASPCPHHLSRLPHTHTHTRCLPRVFLLFIRKNVGGKNEEKVMKKNRMLMLSFPLLSASTALHFAAKHMYCWTFLPRKFLSCKV